MNSLYNETEGRWSPEIAWWLSGYALQDIVDYMYKTGSRRYMSIARHTIELQKEPLPWWPQGGGYFRADSTDDTGCKALALIRMYDLTHDDQYLNISVLDETYMYQYWTDDECAGGLYQDIRNRAYKNAISNELYILLAASLYNRILPENTTYLTRAEAAWQWFNASGMINADSLVNDGLAETADGVCFNNRGTTWTYNQGVILGALVELWRATGDDRYLSEARRIADAVVITHNSTLTQDGILTEPCDGGESLCNNDQQIFKGIFARYLADLSNVVPGDPYREFLVRNARSAFERARNETGFYDVSWKGPFRNATLGTQASAASLFISLI
ncbi:putative glycosyl hydrolase [Echria macrotheca]|uniref:Glycosyl hydrolase n=1 Tax=Echria macrotheca TaxID=438768 RepID=A0AAJ0F315_9PEZI|nr:putative glycosyl hydrolase [Echria macrotheca]